MSISASRAMNSTLRSATASAIITMVQMINGRGLSVAITRKDRSNN
jgi:hypothetical protein